MCKTCLIFKIQVYQLLYITVVKHTRYLSWYYPHLLDYYIKTSYYNSAALVIGCCWHNGQIHVSNAICRGLFLLFLFNATITLFTPKVDLEKWTYPMEDVTFVKNRTFKKIFNICFLNALYLTDSYQTSQF